jgi:hypothetical protein
MIFLCACVDVEGGAVELSWEIRTAQGGRPDQPCATSGIAEIGLCIRGCGADPAAEPGTCTGELICPHARWECEKFTGSTRFDVSTGPAELFIEAYCQDGTKAQGVQVPGPIVRTIAFGQVAQLNALLITLPATDPACPVF